MTDGVPDDAAASRPDLEIEFPPRPEYVRVVRYAIGALGKLHGISDDLSEDIKLAVSEACTSALVQGAQDAEAVRIRAEADLERVVVEVIDPSSELARVVSGRPTELNTEDMPFERALSLPVIRGLVDELAVSPLEGGGASVRMVVSIQDQLP